MYSYLVQHVHTENSTGIMGVLNKIVPEHLEWVSVYWVFAVTALLMIIIIGLIKFPAIELQADEKIGTTANFRELLKNKFTILFFFGTFTYVGTEQGIANWMSKFLQLYHGLSPETTGAKAVAWFWGLMTAGCLLGLVLLKIFDSRKVLQLFVAGAIVSLTAGLFGSAQVAVVAFPLCGFFASVMWSIVISLGLNSVPNHHGSFAGILCTGIVGGAVVPLLIGGLSDFVGLKAAMFLLYLTLAYLFSMGIWAKPLVNNAVSEAPFRDLFKKKNMLAD
jgi:fucose permease